MATRLMLLAVFVFLPQSSLRAAEVPKPVAKPRIELALLLNTSSSMDGLISQAQTKLWKIVGEFETAKRGGQHADVYVALYEYGNDRLSGEEGYIRQVMPLTRDLDKISEELFALTTNGGSEHCGQVIGRAVEELKWSSEHADLRSIFIAGNEPFTQGPVDYKQACHDAANKSITVSTIHCGDYDQGVVGMWAEGAKLADVFPSVASSITCDRFTSRIGVLRLRLHFISVFRSSSANVIATATRMTKAPSGEMGGLIMLCRGITLRSCNNDAVH